MATSKLLKPTNVTISIPAFTDQPDQRVNSNCIDKEADAINSLSDQIANLDGILSSGTLIVNGTLTSTGTTIDVSSYRALWIEIEFGTYFYTLLIPTASIISTGRKYWMTSNYQNATYHGSVAVFLSRTQIKLQYAEQDGNNPTSCSCVVVGYK